MAFSLVLHGSVPKDEICGVIVGHGKTLPILSRLVWTNLLIFSHSLVLLLRRLPIVTRRPTTFRSTDVVEKIVRGKTAGYGGNANPQRDCRCGCTRGSIATIHGGDRFDVGL